MSGEPLSASIDPKILQDLAKHFQTPTQLSGFSRLNIAADTAGSSSPSLASPMNNPPSASAAPINIAGIPGAAQHAAGAAASFGTDYDRSGLAHSFQQQLQQQAQSMQQAHPQHPGSFHHPHTPQQSLFRAHLGPGGQPEMFSPATDDLGDLSPASSYPNHSLAAMASGALPTSIPGALLGAQRPVAVADHMLRMQAFSTSPPPSGSPNFHSMSLPAQADWFENHLAHQQSIGSALDPSSFAAQHIAGSANAEFSPQNPALMSLVEGEDGDSQKSYEKRRRRRESHNAVERRRRDNINDRIQELYQLLPEAMTDINVKPNKGVILKKSVEYIHQLQQALQSQNARIQELESGIPSSMGAQQQQQQHQHQQHSQHQQHQQHQQQASSGLAAMLAGATGINASRPQPNSGL
ncbi:Cell morphogenesis protein PAG1 [Coemansia javaensis]|uniref:Cell morphogenesis protein PAG1 n=1 Tax=Coemansia javaensis TaxID=2761396 RepID=A0A9W8LID2_9FUNG|nr:Cell morphogenesis protein PAG1 [Coemansia javaensis]